MAFGKKPCALRLAQVEAPAGELRQGQLPASEPQRSLLSEDLFETPAPVGQILEQIGVAREDEPGVFLAHDGLDERIERERHLMMSFMGDINIGLPDGVNVVPLLMIPEECWSGPNRNFLVSVLNISPFGTWNMLPLPKDAQSADQLHLKPHPGNAPVNLIAKANEFVSDLATEMQRACEVLAQQMAQGAAPDFDVAMRAQDEARRRLRGFAFYIAGQRVGAESRARSRELFFAEKNCLKAAG